MALSKVGSNQIDSAASITVSGNLSADGGTIKLDGNYPTGTNNVALGDAALGGGSLSGGSNVAIGTSALDANTSGTTNIAIGVNALGANTTASDNVAVGHSALKLNTTGTYNVAVGYEALDANTTANNNTAVGYGTLTANTTASGNTALGYEAGKATTTGAANTFLGYRAGFTSTDSPANTILGYRAGETNSSSTGYNVFVGNYAGYSNTSGHSNCFVGARSGGLAAGYYVTTGSKNTIIGGFDGNQGSRDIRTSSNNIVISDGDGNPRIFVNNGGNAYIDTTNDYGSYTGSINVGSGGYTLGFGTSNGQFRNIYAVNSGGSIALYFHSGSNIATLSTGGAWTDASDASYKRDITDLSYGIDTVKSLQPRMYHLVANENDDDPQIGFVAQEVEAHVPEVVVGGEEKDGSIKKGVSYGRMTAVLTKALQEAVAKIETLEAKVAALEAG